MLNHVNHEAAAITTRQQMSTTLATVAFSFLGMEHGQLHCHPARSR